MDGLMTVEERSCARTEEVVVLWCLESVTSTTTGNEPTDV